MKKYKHRVNYYETDRMKITHHSNYFRWMEEARVDFLAQIGWGYERLEENGIVSPVTKIECEYKNSTTFNDVVEISVKIKKYTGVRLEITYVMNNCKDGKLVAIGESHHCFLNESGIPISLKKFFPDFHDKLKQLEEEQ